MAFLEDIWITLEPKDVSGFVSQDSPAPADQEIEAAIAFFHQNRAACADYEVIPPEKSPVSLLKAPSGVVAVAATLGDKLEQSPQLPGLEPCLKAALAQLQDYINYRLTKRMSPKKLHLGWPMVPGGAVAEELTPEQVLSLLPESESGIRIEEGRLVPKWSLVFLYPLGPKPDKTSSCGSCQKDCALRK